MNKLIAIGDIHGCFDKLYDLVEHHVKLQKRDKMVLLGDYIDRGPDSKEVLDYIMSLINEGFDIVPLMGNHEDMLLRARSNPMDTLGWMVNGGATTMKSFGFESVSKIDTKYISFIESMLKYYSHNNFLFVHGGFNDDIEDPFTDEHSMIWERRFEYRSPAFKGMTIVHGHRPNRLSDLRESLSADPKVINLDTGCVYGPDDGFGFLSALEFNTGKLYSV